MPGYGGGGCFVAGTKIHTDKGLKEIDKIIVGDLVASYDFETKKIEYTPVVSLFSIIRFGIVEINVNGEKIKCSSNHKFWDVIKNEYIEAKLLKKANFFKFLSISGGGYESQDVDVRELINEKPIRVYNFKLKEYRNYFVGEKGFLVAQDKDFIDN